MEEEAAGLGVVIFYLVFPVIALVFWWAIGHFTERRHLRSLAEREAAIGVFPVTSLKTPIGCQSGATNPPAIVCGEAVVASDGFKSWVFGLKNIVGGESKTFSRLYDRARREAVLRMIDEAKAGGYNAICNVRFESVDIGGNTSNPSKKNMNMAVCQAYGTAYTRSL
jgi:uncharacterized protein YbjQ (UPF0145 family)